MSRKKDGKKAKRSTLFTPDVNRTLDRREKEMTGGKRFEITDIRRQLWEYTDEVKKAVKLATECLKEGGHVSKLKECPVCNPKYARDLIRRHPVNRQKKERR